MKLTESLKPIFLDTAADLTVLPGVYLWLK